MNTERRDGRQEKAKSHRFRLWNIVLQHESRREEVRALSAGNATLSKIKGDNQ